MAWPTCDIHITVRLRLVSFPKKKKSYCSLVHIEQVESGHMETYKDIMANFCRNNAGALFGKFELSQDGLEKTFATNHMGEAFQTHVCETSAIRAQNLLSGTILVQDLHKFSHHERIQVYSNIERIICVVTGLMVSFSPVDLITVCRTICVDQPSIGDHCSNCKKKR